MAKSTKQAATISKDKNKAAKGVGTKIHLSDPKKNRED
jgi:hypothetical protein